MSDYKLIPITELLSDIIDNRGKSCPTQESGFPLIATNCIKHSSIYPTFENIRYVSEETRNNWFRAELKPNDILFVNKGTPGRVCLVPDPITFCAAQDMVGLRANPDKIYYKYLFAILRSTFIQQKIANFHVGIAIPHFKKSDMDKLLIPVPDMKLQIEIGDMYCQLSEKIETNNRINSELESMAKTIYDYWFTQFDFPDENGKPYKSSGGKMVWNEELKREIPEGWEVKPLSYHLYCNINTMKSSDNYTYIEYLDTSNLTQNKVDYIQKVTSEEGYPSRAKRIVMDNDILYSTVRPAQCHYGIIKHSTSNLIASTGFSVLSAKKGTEYNEIFYLFITNESNSNILDSIANSSVSSYPSINSEDILNLKIALPSDIAIIKKIALKLSTIFEMISNNQKQNRELASLRDWLLPMLMNGQVGFE